MVSLVLGNGRPFLAVIKYARCLEDVRGCRVGVSIGVGCDTPGLGDAGSPLDAVGRGVGVDIGVGCEPPRLGDVGNRLDAVGHGVGVGIGVGCDTAGLGDDVGSCDMLVLRNVGIGGRSGCAHPVDIHSCLVDGCCSSSISVKDQSASINSPYDCSGLEATLRHSQQGCCKDCDTVSSPVKLRRHSQP